MKAKSFVIFLCIGILFTGCASTAGKISRATDGAASTCGLYSNTLPGAVLCLGVQTVNFSSVIVDRVANSPVTQERAEETQETKTNENAYDGVSSGKKGFWDWFFSLSF